MSSCYWSLAIDDAYSNILTKNDWRPVHWWRSLGLEGEKIKNAKTKNSLESDLDFRRVIQSAKQVSQGLRLVVVVILSIVYN